MKKSRGFTLMEILIVVAIIAILVAIAIPVFSAQLEKSREAVCSGNRRSLQSVVMASFITGKADGSAYKNTLEAFNDVFDAAAKENYVCPSEGEISWSQDSDEFGHAVCNKHGALQGKAALQTLAEQIQDHGSDIYKYLSTIKGFNGGDSLDYPLPETGDNTFAGWTKGIMAAAEKAGIDLSEGSWRLYKWSSTDYSIFYYPGDISQMQEGAELKGVTKWNIPVNGGDITSKTVDSTVEKHKVGSVEYNMIKKVSDQKK